MRLKIVPLGKVPRNVLDEATEELRNTYGMVSEILPQIEIPKEYYNYLRHQYISPQVLEFLASRFTGRILGITSEDLYAGNLNFVFGQAQLGGRVAVVSICRLNPTFYKNPPNEELFVQRAVKECIHEVGHMLGLEHCKNPECVMSFSNTVFDVDRKTKNLCDKCKLKLKL